MTYTEARKICSAYNRIQAWDSNCKAVLIYEDAGCPMPFVIEKESGAIVRKLKAGDWMHTAYTAGR